VDAILGAARRLVVRAGREALSTNKVAELAGVSIGSLYQYFPSKEALLAALAEQHAEEGLQVLVAALAKSEAAGASDDLPTTVRLYIDAMVGIHSTDPELHRALVETLPVIPGGQEMIRRRSAHAAGLVRGWLEQQRGRIRKVDLDVATFMLLTSVESIAHLQVLARPASMTREVLVNELTQLVLGYLGVR
jgi:AcrR family transcriptional regulator